MENKKWRTITLKLHGLIQIKLLNIKKNRDAPYIK